VQVPPVKGAPTRFPAHRRFNTGYEEAGVGHAIFKWSTEQGGANLVDAFEGLHSWSKEGALKWPTSRSTARAEHIDYIFYTKPGVGNDARAAIEVDQVVASCPAKPSPNHDEPSDHIPVGVSFKWAEEKTTTETADGQLQNRLHVFVVAAAIVVGFYFWKRRL
jgi:hypothetical protein